MFFKGFAVRSGVNSQGNHFCTLDYGRTARNRNTYHYYNKDGSYFYNNPDGSTYFNSGKGYEEYTSPPGDNNPCGIKYHRDGGQGAPVYPQPLYPPPDCPQPTGSARRNVAEYIHEDVVWTQPAGDFVKWHREDYHEEVKQDVVQVKEEVVHIKEQAIYIKEEGVY